MRRRDRAPVEWDGGEWVDVGTDGRWRPTAGERLRSIVVLAVVVGILGLLAAFASVDDGDDGEDAAADGTTTSTSVDGSSSTTAEAVEPNSVAGEPPPDACTSDDRGGAPLADRGAVSVLVLNGTPQGGFASAVTNVLDAIGYETVEPGNAPVQAASEIRFEAGSCAEADQLRADLGLPVEIMPLEPGDVEDGTPAQIVVTLGRDSI